VVVRANALSYTHREATYYSPNVDVSGGFALIQRFELGSNVELELEALAGYGYTRDGRLRASGPEWGGGGELAWSFRSWSLGVEARYAETQRSIPYGSLTAGLRIGREC